MKKQKLQVLDYKDYENGLQVKLHKKHLATNPRMEIGEVVSKSASDLHWYVWFPAVQMTAPFYPSELIRYENPNARSTSSL